MPIEIKELHIKINLDEGPNRGAGAGDDQDSEGKEQLISACVEQVMGILERQKER
ncbi:DUF5908 family protein [Sungkyunkwania multivorans]|uniref:DUF5908 family protein n=1 Tax=Sungkyunkwania multivorans TaxID=1173618 RepID=A0ABW3CYF5_9FLAO